MGEEKNTEKQIVDKASKEQERYDAMNLIRVGNRTKDDFTKLIGQARLRVLEGKETLEDLELLGKLGR